MRRRRTPRSFEEKEVERMRLTGRDIAATALTALVVLTFAATHESWSVPLVGDSHRWAAAAVALLGVLTCALGTREEGSRMPRPLALLGIAALVLAGLAIGT